MFDDLFYIVNATAIILMSIEEKRAILKDFNQRQKKKLSYCIFTICFYI